MWAEPHPTLMEGEADLGSDLPQWVTFGESVAFSCLVREFKGSWYFFSIFGFKLFRVFAKINMLKSNFT